MRQNVIKTELSCPTCRYVTLVPNGSTEALQENYVVNQALRQGLQVIYLQIMKDSIYSLRNEKSLSEV